MSDTAEAGEDSLALHEGSYPYLQACILVHLRVDHLPRSHQVPVSTKGKEIRQNWASRSVGFFSTKELQELWHFYS